MVKMPKRLNKGEQVHVDPEDIRQLKDKSQLPSIEDLSGSDPDFTGELSTEEYIKRLRNG